MGIENIAATAFITPFLTAPSRGPIFHRVRPGQKCQPEMQNLVGVEIPALKSDWSALQAHYYTLFGPALLDAGRRVLCNQLRLSVRQSVLILQVSSS